MKYVFPSHFEISPSRYYTSVTSARSASPKSLLVNNPLRHQDLRYCVAWIVSMFNDARLSQIVFLVPEKILSGSEDIEKISTSRMRSASDGCIKPSIKHHPAIL